MPGSSNHDSTKKTFQFIKLANEFDLWVHSKNQFNQSDMELLFDWLDSDDNSRGIEEYDDFLALAQEVAALGYKTAIDVPISAEDFANRKVANRFESWLKKTNQPLMRSADYLLAWIEKGDGSRHITGYQHFLQLTQTLVNRGYKAPIDVPITEATFKQIYDIKRKTIFLDLVKKFLVDKINSYKNRSSASDFSTSNELLRLFKLGSTELSESRQALTEHLLLKLHQVTGRGCDLESCHLLKSLIAECMKTASNLKNYTKGRFEQTLTEAMLLIQNIYDKLEEIQLLDVSHNDDPLNQFRYYMALYFSKKVVETLPPSYLPIQLTPASSLVAQKEKLILQTLKECAFHLEVLNKGPSDYHQNRRKRVLDHIEQLRRTIIATCEKHSIKSLPVSISFFSIANVNMPSLGSNDFLLTCLLKAEKKISSETVDTTIELGM
ncbi:hypothetical protein [Legionella cardiaca]|uniref:Uncharacterized protein n=1 Tax=Legionella cardiaca TaxID=1071983 RepID=A0ABY8AW36_9GAMM|nr:hypothetical protein [Legionella cardiaca]WED43720.1 hypothetical protein PXX05_02785 [Legionella cardiaca]